MTGNNIPVTIVEDSTFKNNFGDFGASIHLNIGGGLYCKRTKFIMDEKYIKYNAAQVEGFQFSKETYDWEIPQTFLGE